MIKLIILYAVLKQRIDSVMGFNQKRTRFVAGSPDAVLESHILQEYGTSSQDATDDEAEAEVVDSDVARLTQEEEKEAGVVRMHVYKSYWRAVGSCLAPIVLLALALMQGERYPKMCVPSLQ